MTDATRNMSNGHVLTASGVLEIDIKAQTKHCSAKCEKEIKVNNSLRMCA